MKKDVLTDFAIRLAKEDKQEKRYPIDNFSEFVNEFITCKNMELLDAYSEYKKELGNYDGLEEEK